MLHGLSSLVAPLFLKYLTYRVYHLKCNPVTITHYGTFKAAVSQHTYGGAGGERMYSSYSFTTSALDGGWVVSVTPQLHITPKERTPSTHCAGGWVDPRASLDTKARGEILSPLLGIEPRMSVCLVCSQTLYWLSYPGSTYYGTKTKSDECLSLCNRLSQPPLWCSNQCCPGC
jgi:hypothetical protein